MREYPDIQRGDNHGGARSRLLKAEAADGAAIHPELLDNGRAHLHLGLACHRHNTLVVSTLACLGSCHSFLELGC